MKNLNPSREIFKPSASPPAFWWAGWWRYGEEVGKWARRGRHGVVPQFRFNGRRAWVRTCTGAVVTFRNIKEPAEPESAGDDRAPPGGALNARSLIRQRPRSTAGPPKRKQRPCRRALRSAAEAACRSSGSTLPNIDRFGLRGKRVVKPAALLTRGVPNFPEFVRRSRSDHLTIIVIRTPGRPPWRALPRL